jgi:RES domain-containing protein
VLDEFSDANVRDWAKRSDALESLEIRYIYGLAAQRQIHLGDLLRTLRDAARPSTFPFTGWVRICDYRYSHQPLSAYGSTIGTGGRFNYGDALDNIKEPPFPALYLASNERVAHREFFGAPASKSENLTASDLALIRERDYALCHLSGTIHHLLDLTRPARLEKFAKVLGRFTVSKEVQALADAAGLTPRPLVCDVPSLLQAVSEPNWRGWSRQYGLPASCQIFGELAWSAGFEGILYRSTKKGGECLALFPQNLDKSESWVSLVNEAPTGTIARLDSGNWEDVVTER